MAFVIRQFDYSQSLGKKLKAIRAAAGWTLSEMVIKTKVRKSFLQAFEAGDFARLPDPVYARNYLKIYVRALGGDVHYFLQQFEMECGTCDFTKNARLPRRRARALQFLVASRFVKVCTLGLIGLAIVAYLGLQIRAIVSPPELLVFSPADGVKTQKALITVAGQAQEGAQVRVNGVDVLLSRDGTFEIDVALERGLNVIAIESQKRYSKSATEYRRVVLGEHQEISFLP
jgi:transcriptional regulator with XRE-family HTH domain